MQHQYCSLAVRFAGGKRLYCSRSFASLRMTGRRRMTGNIQDDKRAGHKMTREQVKRNFSSLRIEYLEPDSKEYE